MKANLKNNERLSEHTFTIERTFDAQRKMVFDCWTKPDLLAKWLGPKGTKSGKYTMDLRPGGVCHYSIVIPGQAALRVGDNARHGDEAASVQMWGKLVYREIKAPERLVYTQSFSNEKGEISRHPLSPSWPLAMLTEIIFEEQGSKTKVTVNWTPINPTPEEDAAFAAAMAGMNQGWSGGFEALDELLASLQK